MAKQRTSGKKSAIEHGGDSVALAGARLRPMQEVIRNSPRPKRTPKKKQEKDTGRDMADPSTSREKVVVASRSSKEGRKLQTQTPKSKSNGNVEKIYNSSKDGKDKDKDGKEDEGSEESNIDDHHNENDDDEDDDGDEEDEESDENEEESEFEEVLGEGMYEVEAIRKKRTRKVIFFLSLLPSSPR
jgi:TATA-binding protein-associated factor Taf7